MVSRAEGQEAPCEPDDKMVLHFYFRLGLMEEHPEAGIENIRAEKVDHPFEGGQQRHSGPDHRPAHDQRAQHAPEQKPMLLVRRDLERGKNEHEDKNVIHAQSVFDQIAGEKFEPFASPFLMHDPKSEPNRQRHPDQRGDQRFPHGNGARLAMQHGQVEDEQRQHHGVESDPEGERRLHRRMVAGGGDRRKGYGADRTVETYRAYQSHRSHNNSPLARLLRKKSRFPVYNRQYAHTVSSVPMSTLPPASNSDALSSEIRKLGHILGEIIVKLDGKPILDLEEKLRLLAKSSRTGDTRAEAELLSAVKKLSVSEAARTALAFTGYFELVNLAEETHRVRLLRQRRRAQYSVPGTPPMRESIGAALREFKARNVPTETVQMLLDKLSIELVFTAHPTESKRRTMLNKLQRLSHRLQNPGALIEDEITGIENPRALEREM